MSQRELIDEIKSRWENDNEAMKNCRIFPEEKALRYRMDGSDNSYCFYSKVAGGVYEHSIHRLPHDLNQEQLAVLSAELFRINMAEDRVPLATELVEFAKQKERPTHWERIDLLIWTIERLAPGNAFGIEIGESNPAHRYIDFGAEPDVRYEPEVRYEKEMTAATACRNEFEFENVVQDATDEGWIKTEFVNPPGEIYFARLTRKGMRRASTLPHVLSRASTPDIDTSLAAKNVSF